MSPLSDPERLRALAAKLLDQQQDAELFDGPPEPVKQSLPDLARHVRLWSPRTKEMSLVLFHEEDAIELLYHRLDGRTYPCLQPIRYCYGCKLNLPKRSRAYIGAHLQASRVPIVFEMTPLAWADVRQYLPEPKPLRRLLVKTGRSAARANSRQLVECIGVYPAAAIPYCVSCRYVLQRVFNLPYMEIEALRDVAMNYRHRLDLDHPLE